MSEEHVENAGEVFDEADEGRDAAAQRLAVRERYATIAEADAGSSSTDDEGCCGTGGDDQADGSGACGTDESASAECCSIDARGDGADDTYSPSLGYTDADIDAVADGANLGLGCGNPTAIASLQPGETVLDLGSGGGFDCFLAAREVGDSGRVIGVDMTPEMVERARENVERNHAPNVEFRLGEIEHLPVADATVDVVISNCVVNLSPNKPRVFREAFRALRPGGRLSISDVVMTAPIPADLRVDPTSVASCVAGASPSEAVESMLREAGFVGVSIELAADGEDVVREWDAERDLSEFVVAARIIGRKPRSQGPDGPQLWDRGSSSDRRLADE